MAHLELIPRDSPADSGSQSFRGCLLGCESGGEALRASTSAAAISDFMIGIDTAEKAVAITFNGPRDALDLDQIHASPDQHGDHITMG
jgi:hypothetical protein